MSLLEVKGLEKNFGGVNAVDDCTFSIEENYITALIGPNGAGKTTLFNLITGFSKPSAGRINFKGEPIDGMQPYKIARLGVARTFQLNRLFGKLTALENLLLAKRIKGEKFSTVLFNPNFVALEDKTNRERALEFLKLVGLEDKKDSLAENLSYGQQKLLEIARTLCTEGTLLLLDEPVAGVNPVFREKMKKIILDLKKEGKTIFFIEHDLKFVMDLADQVIVLDHGKQIAQGKPSQIKKNKKVLQAYLGEKVKL